MTDENLPRRLPLSEGDQDLRGALTRKISELGHAPPLETLAVELSCSPGDVAAALQRLADQHALLLHPASARPWAVHPFALAPASCWVRTPSRGYWANCLYCGFGVAAALGCDAMITTRYGGEEETVRFLVQGGRVARSDDLFHLSTPAALWWDNVMFACSSFQPFKSMQDVDRWCVDHDFPRGAVLTIPQLWAFAADWYGDYLKGPWRKRTADEIRKILERNGLTGEFWLIE